VALERDKLDDYILRRGPFLVHVTRADRVSAVLTAGLRPGSELGVSSKGGFFKTREGHVYLCERRKVPVVEVSGTRAYLQIDLRRLDPRFIDPDEDAVQASFDIRGGGWVAQAPPRREEDEGTNPEAVGQALAEWADSTEGFDASEVTAKSLETGWVSYRGTVPPDAITIVTIPSEAAQLFHDGARRLFTPDLVLAAPPALGFYKTEVARAVALARSLIESALNTVGESAEQILPDWPFPEHAIPTRDRLIDLRRDRSRAGEQGQADVIHAARGVADAVPCLQPELGWSATGDACVRIAEAGLGVVRVVRGHCGEAAASRTAQTAMDAIAAVPDQA